MKKISLSILVLVFCTELLNAQGAYERPYTHIKNDWSVGFGVNAVYDSGFSFREITNLTDNWNLTNPVYVSVEYYFNEKYSIASTLSFNNYKAGKVIDFRTVQENSGANYSALDLAGKYSLRTLFSSNAFEPFVVLGGGYTRVGNYVAVLDDRTFTKDARDRLTINTGAGFNYWFSRTLGLTANITAKFGVGENVSNQFQTNLGLFYKILGQE